MQSTSADKPQVTTYSSGYEHSPEHWMEVRRLVEESYRDTDPGLGCKPPAATPKSRRFAQAS